VASRIIAVVIVAALHPLAAAAQPRPKIALTLESRTEGQADSDAAGKRLAAEVRSGLAAMPDVELVPADGARRAIWLITGSAPGAVAASLMVTERYDRETLMVLGIEDDEMAFRMMALQIVSDHQIFTGRTTAELAQRIVKALDTGVLARLRKLPPRP
jgi:hypothetical protein